MKNIVIVNERQVGVKVSQLSKAHPEHVKRTGYRLIYLKVPGRGGKPKQVMQWVKNINWRYPHKKDKIQVTNIRW